jgi:hypothetical protein
MTEVNYLLNLNSTQSKSTALRQVRTFNDDFSSFWKKFAEQKLFEGVETSPEWQTNEREQSSNNDLTTLLEEEVSGNNETERADNSTVKYGGVSQVISSSSNSYKLLYSTELSYSHTQFAKFNAVGAGVTSLLSELLPESVRNNLSKKSETSGHYVQLSENHDVLPDKSLKLISEAGMLRLFFRDRSLSSEQLLESLTTLTSFVRDKLGQKLISISVNGEMVWQVETESTNDQILTDDSSSIIEKYQNIAINKFF